MQWVTCAGAFLMTLDILIVTVALTRIGEELGGGTVGQQWVVDGYILPLAALLLFGGNLADRLGANRAFGLGTALFGLTSALCAVAPTIGFLIVARAGQGAAAALVLPASLALVRETFPDPARRARALGVWAVGGAVSAAAGPLLGGLLTMVDWRWVFAVNIPVCAAMVSAQHRIAASPRRPVPFDAVGQVLGAVALVALVHGLIRGGADGFTDPLAVGSLLLAVAALISFLAIEARVRRPVIPFSLFRPRDMRIALAVALIFTIGWFGTVFLCTLYLQQHLGLTPLLAGLAFLPSALLSVVGNLASSRMATRFGPRTPVLVGQLSMLVGLVALAVAAPLGSPVLMSALIVLVGTGGSVLVPTVTGLVLATAPTDLAGTASAVLNVFRQVGGALAVAVFGGFVAVPDRFVAGMQVGLVLAAGLSFVAVGLSLGIRRDTPSDARR